MVCDLPQGHLRIFRSPIKVLGVTRRSPNVPASSGRYLIWPEKEAAIYGNYDLRCAVDPNPEVLAVAQSLHNSTNMSQKYPSIRVYFFQE